MGEDLYQRQRRHFENRQKQNERLRQIGRWPEIKRYQTFAIIAALIGITFLLIICMFFDSMSQTTRLWLEGFSGIFALLTLIFVGIFCYKQFNYLRNHPEEK